ncbi:hypothetical protein TrCOL_g2990 [Triparma columacea]|uniref:Uncharacterized protein n=2 Tax=Triparma columacea TaxID=722753 RepID=A0A9W7G0Z0_9STRA|nr:hypothetical protein TrCOL_g2990 [Triparma columacea]
MFRTVLFAFALVSTTAFTPTTRVFGIRGVHTTLRMASRYSLPDQPARFAKAKAEKNARHLDIDSCYDPAFLAGKRVAVTGANRGIGLSLAKELTAQGAKVVGLVRKSSPELDALNPDEVITGIDVTSDEACASIGGKVKNGPIDILINNAGYFYEPVEKIEGGELNFSEEMKMIDICAVGPLRVTSALYNANLLTKEKSTIAMITSQGGSIDWRTTQNPDGGDYGHHMSKAAANMMGVLVAQEMRKFGIACGILHPGFNKTEMTAKYAKIWEVEGAVDAEVGAKRVLHEVGRINMETTGKFINCEDGLEIPW